MTQGIVFVIKVPHVKLCIETDNVISHNMYNQFVALKTFKAIFYSSSQLIIFVKTVAVAPMIENCLKSL